MGSITKFCDRMRYWCDEANLGYDQYQRWDIRVGGECDCSSLVIFALREAGFDTGSASYTGNMSDELTARGWRRLPANISTCQPGDILLNDTHHVCAVISGYGWDARIAQASIDERGRATGGQSGDQTGGETNTKPVYTYRHGWDCILRWGGGSDVDPGKLEVDGYLGTLSVTAWQLAMGTVADGVITGQDSCNREHLSNLVAVTYDGGGSQLVQAIQRKVGADVDGYMGPQTVRCLQAWLNNNCGESLEVDGYLGPCTAKAVQRAINAGKF